MIITAKLKTQILKVRKSGQFNMFAITDVQRYALDKGYNELVVLLEENKKAYTNFILGGERG